MFPFQIAVSWLINGGYWDDPPSMVLVLKNLDLFFQVILVTDWDPMVNHHFAPPFGEIFLGYFFQAFSGRKSTIGFLRGGGDSLNLP